jgi:uncharacterized protein YjbI with pentapeptide repeats
MTIYDKAGNAIAVSDPPDTRHFDNMTIRNASMVGMELEGITFEESDLQGSDFSGSDLYGAIFSDTNCDSSSFVEADLRCGFFFRSSFRNSDLRSAKMGLDQLGGGLDLDAVDFTNANLDGADFTGASYNSETIFPEGFNPLERGLRLKRSV